MSRKFSNHLFELQCALYHFLLFHCSHIKQSFEMGDWESPQTLKFFNCQTHMASLNMLLSLKLSRHKPAGTDCLKSPAVPQDTRRRLLPPDST